MRTTVILAEGSLEQVIYTKLLERLYEARIGRAGPLPPNIREFLESIRRRLMICSTPSRIVVVVDCGGSAGVKLLLGRILSRPELPAMIEEGLDSIIVSADLDANPVDMVRGRLESLKPRGLRVAGSGNKFEVHIGGRKLLIIAVAQGYTREYKPNATGQVEDSIEDLASNIHTEIEAAISCMEERLGARLNTKQRTEIYSAILTPHQGVQRLAARLIEESTEERLRQAMPGIIEAIQALFRLNHEL